MKKQRRVAVIRPASLLFAFPAGGHTSSNGLLDPLEVSRAVRRYVYIIPSLTDASSESGGKVLELRIGQISMNGQGLLKEKVRAIVRSAGDHRSSCTWEGALVTDAMQTKRSMNMLVHEVSNETAVHRV